MIKAQVIRSSQREFICRLKDTGDVVNAKALGNLLKNQENIVVGDKVLLEKKGNEFEIHQVEKRSSEIFRIIVREQKKKVTAANCDLLVIVASVSRPTYKRGIIERFLVRAEQWGITPIVVFNKMDEYDPSKINLKFEKDLFKNVGATSFEISALDPNYKNTVLENGPRELKNILKGQLALFLGQSGVGKSKTISLIGNVNLKTKEVGKKGKGTHSTTWSEIIDCGNFSLIDSPGIRSFSLDDIFPDELISYFPDLSEIAVKCKFPNCAHEENSKNCEFRKLDPSKYENQLILSRLDSYLKIKEEISQKPNWQKKIE
jgi:ribosome biogenesis GTPase / thiamine phosphate phosphatase